MRPALRALDLSSPQVIPVPHWQGYGDVRLALALAASSVLTTPLGVALNRRLRPATPAPP